MKILVTGSAGFIGFHLSKLLLSQGFEVHGYDGLTKYYDVNLKIDRHKMLAEFSNFSHTIGMLEDQLPDQVYLIRNMQENAAAWPSSAPSHRLCACAADTVRWLLFKHLERLSSRVFKKFGYATGQLTDSSLE